MVADCSQNTFHTQTLEERCGLISSTSSRNSRIRFSASSTSEIGTMSVGFLIVTDFPSRNQLLRSKPIRFVIMSRLIFSSDSSSLKVRNNCQFILHSDLVYHERILRLSVFFREKPNVLQTRPMKSTVKRLIVMDPTFVFDNR